MLRGGGGNLPLARLLTMGCARALTRHSSPKHVPLAQSDLDQLEHEEEVRVDVADGVTAATKRPRWKAPSEGLGVRAPGCCAIEVGGEKLLLSCVDGRRLHVRTVPSSTETRRSAAEGETRTTLQTIAEVGHSTCFEAAQDVVVTGGQNGEVTARPCYRRAQGSCAARWLPQPRSSSRRSAPAGVGLLRLRGAGDGVEISRAVSRSTTCSAERRTRRQRTRMMVSHVACSVGEGMVASGGSDGALRVRGTKDGQLLHEMRRGVAEGAKGGSGG